MKDLINKINSTIGRINPRYDATIKDIETIQNAANNTYTLVCLGFRFGYMQGVKAEKAAQRKQDKLTK